MKHPATSLHVCLYCKEPVAQSEALCAACSVRIEAASELTEAVAAEHDPEATGRYPSRIKPQLYQEAVRQAEEVADAPAIPSSEADETTFVRAPERAEKLAIARALEEAQGEETVRRSVVRLPAAKPTTAALPGAKPSSRRFSLYHFEKHLFVRRRFYLTGAVLILVVLAVLFWISQAMQQKAARDQSQAAQARMQLDDSLQHARDIGVAWFQLQPITDREQQISSQYPSFLLFQPQRATDFYQRQYRGYHALFLKVPASINAATGQDQHQAQQDIQAFESTLASVNAQGVTVPRAISQEFSQDQVVLSSATYPRDFTAISDDSQNALQALNLLVTTSHQLAEFSAMIKSMQFAHQDITASQLAYQNDRQLLDQAVQPADFEALSALVQAHYQVGLVNAVRAFPTVGAMKLQALKAGVKQLHLYGTNIRSYPALLEDRQQMLAQATTISERLAFFNQIDADLLNLQNSLSQGQARYLVQQFHQEVDRWGHEYSYHDNYDGNAYQLDNGYMQPGIGQSLDSDLAGARTPADFNAVLNEVSSYIFNLHQLELDYGDKTSYDQVHATDLHMLDRYHLRRGQVMVVSLVEQVMRIYQDGKLVKSFYVTTGRQELPSLPGVWSVQDRRAPVIFKSGEPQSSRFWFPDTPIHYAILYHVGGYFVHDAPWRADYGPGTEFPHQDSSGTSSYNFDGSHGCINLEEQNAAWVYEHTSWNTAIVVY